MIGWTLLTLCFLLTMPLTVTLRAADDVKPGLIGEYYQFDAGLADFPAIPADRKPTIRRVDKKVAVENTTSNFYDTNMDSNFFVKWTGSVKIDKAGKYKFGVESDDGSRLFIDGKLVVNNPGSHGMIKVDGEIELQPGQHELKLDYFNGDGGMGCKFSWVQPGKGEEIVNENSLWHKADAE